MRRRLAARIGALWLVLLTLPSAQAADTVTEDVPIPGGTGALARVLGIDPAPEPARAVAEFARLLHGLPQGINPAHDERLTRLVSHGTAVARFQGALAAARPDGGGLNLAMARAAKSDRRRLQEFLDLVGLRLRERKKQFSVEPRRDRDAVARYTAAVNVGVDLGSIVTRLNAGETVRIEVPSDLVPVPFSALYWAQTFFRQKIDLRDIVTAILIDRRA